MNEIKFGDIFELKTSKGYAYLQYIFNDKLTGEYVRVFYDLYYERPKQFDELLKSDFFHLCFALKAAVKLGIIKKVAYNELSKSFQYPLFFRSENLFKDGYWDIINIKTRERVVCQELTQEQQKYSPWSCWNDTLLIENLENGWRLENWI